MKSIQRLIGIKNLKACGMPLSDIRRFFLLCDLSSDESYHERFDILQRQLEKANRNLEEAGKVAAFMQRKVDHYKDIITHKAEDNMNPNNW